VNGQTVAANPRVLARLLVAQVQDAGLLSMEALANDPIAALEADPAVRVTWVEPASLPPECSIAAACDKSRRPARLLISKDASLGRRCFSVLHEYGHLLRDLIPAVLEVLFAAADAGAALEERICDEFASQVLLPDPFLESVLGPCITAQAVQSLIAAAPASAEACAVAAARKLPAPGYVMLLSPDGTATFTAHNSDVYFIRRGTAQDGLLAQASSGRPVRGREQVRYSTGNRSQEMFLDAATANGRTVAVLVIDSPPWGGLTVGKKRGPEGTTGYCGNCAHEFTLFARPCDTCEQPSCPQCGQCACETPKAVSGERPCDRCYLMLPPAAYPDASSTICSECS
jgi:IrrE N-terminal-like domain